MENPHFMKTIFLFFDGVGVGARNEANPFVISGCRHLPFYRGGMELPDGTPLASIAADAGVAGIPQSATCQTALFTGHCGADLGPLHRRAYPDRRLRALIHRDGLLRRLLGLGCDARFINAYPLHEHLFSADHIHLDEEGGLQFSPEFPHRFRRTLSVTTCLILGAGQRPAGETELRAGQALYQDFSNRSLIDRGLALPEFGPERAADVLVHALDRHDFVLYEFFQTDVLAHRATRDECLELVHRLDRLVGRLLERLDPSRHTLLLTSDHGNLEDMTHRQHTVNPVPLLAWGRLGEHVRRRVSAIEHLTPALLEAAVAGAAPGPV